MANKRFLNPGGWFPGLTGLALGFLALWAPLLEAVENSLESFGQAQLETEVPIQSRGHLVMFSPVREVNDEIRSQSMARLSVQGTGRLYLIDSDSGRSEARRHYRRLLEERDADILFECEGRSCGRSNVWANRVFDQSTLYGRDADQDYLVAASSNDLGDVWLTVVYTITRSNQREYLWVEHLDVEPGTPIPGLSGIERPFQGPVIVPWEGSVTFSFDWTPNDRRRIREWASSDEARVILASHTGLKQGESVEDSMKRAERAVESLSLLLDRSGIRKEQQTVIIVGPGVPVNDPARRGDRVEVMVFKR